MADAASSWGLVAIPDRVATRALNHFVPDEAGCHISTYSVREHGYAQIGWSHQGKTVMTLAHRAAWVAVHGQIPVGMTVDHICHVRRCVRPDHLQLLTNSENAKFNRLDYDPVICPHGHIRSEAGIYEKRQSNGVGVSRSCRACRREQQQHRRSLLKEAVV